MVDRHRWRRGAAAFAAGVAGLLAAASTAQAQAADTSQMRLALLREARALTERSDTTRVIREYVALLPRIEAAGPAGREAAEEVLRSLSIIHFRRREYAEALRYHERLVPLVDSLRGPQSAEAAREWGNLGFLRDAQGQSDAAVDAYERALATLRRVLPADHEDLIANQRGLLRTLRQRADAYGAAKRLAPAWKDLERALALSDSLDGAQSEGSTLILLGLTQLLQPLAADQDAMLDIGPPRLVAVGERTLTLLEAEYGKDDEKVRYIRAALDVLRLGAESVSLDPQAIRAASVRAVAEAEANGKDAPPVAYALVRLAGAEISLRNFPAARAALARARSIRVAAFGEASEPVAEVDRVAGEVLEAEGRRPEARAAYETALAKAERAVGRDSPLLVPYLDALASALRGLGDEAQARQVTRRSTELEAKFAGDADSPTGAVGALLRAADLEDQRKYVEARALRERSLATLLRTFGEGHIVVSVARFSLGKTLINLQDYAAAGTLIRQAIMGTGTTYGVESPEYAIALTMQSELERAMGDYAAAEATLRQIVALNARTLGPAHPQGFMRRFDLADVLFIQRKSAEGAAVVRDVTRDVDTYAREVLPTLSVAEQQAFLEEMMAVGTNYVLLAIYVQRQDLPELYDRLAGWKGLLLRGIERQATVARLAAERGADADLQRLAAVRTQLAELAQRMATMDRDESRRERERLTTEKEALERKLAALAPVTPDPWRGVQALRAKMPPGTAFVDVFRTGGGTSARYAAIAILADSPQPRYADLGPAARIDRFVSDWRRAVTGDQPAQDEAWRVGQSTIGEIAKLLPDSLRFIWYSPDAQLSRIPFAMFSAFDRRIGSAGAAQIPSARALMQLLERTPSGSRSGVALVGGVDFNAGPARGSRPDTRWQELPGTAAEVAAIGRLADSLQVPTLRVTGAEVTPQAVRGVLGRARAVHLATHGFFFGESESVANSRGVVSASPLPGAPKLTTRNPLAESGLALAGANVNAANNLTAEQILGLDLRGLDLIVLSACETGRGAEVTGQGVLGLQASLFAAGTRGMLMSLWKVPDESTAELMRVFYEHLFDGYYPSAALRRAQNHVASMERFKHPIHWAGWVFVGDIEG